MCAICLCAGRIGLGWAHDAISFAYHMFMHSPCICTFFSIYLLYLNCLELFLLFLSSHSLSCLRWSCLWHLSISQLRPRTLCVLGHRLMLERTSRRTFLDEVFIRNTESFCWTFPTLTYPLSFIVGVESHCVTSRSLVRSCWSRSFTPTCMVSIFQYLSFLLAFEVRAL